MAVATALAIAGIASSAGGAIMSFNQAAKQNRLMTQAQQDAANAMAQARGLLGKNYMAGLGIQKEPYELEREALLSTGAQNIQAGVESERGAAATAGRVQAGMNEAQAGQRTAMQKELSDLDLKTAEEASRLRDLDANLYLEEAAGQQQMAKDAAEAKAAAIKSGMASATSAIQQGVQAIPLFGKTGAAKELGKIENTAMGKGKGDYGLNQADMQKSIASMGDVNNVDLSKVGSMNPLQYKDFMSSLDKGTLQKIRANMSTSMSSFNPNSTYSPSPYFSGYNINPFLID